MCKFCFFASKTWFSCNTCRATSKSKNTYAVFFSTSPAPACFACFHQQIWTLSMYLSKWLIQILFSIPYLFLFLDGFHFSYRKKLFLWKQCLPRGPCATLILVMGPVMGLFLLHNEVFLIITVKEIPLVNAEYPDYL